MRNDMRPELSQKNPYWIGKHRYYELKHFCLQYPIWKKARLALDGLSRRPADLQVFVSCGQMKGDPTERCAQSRIFFGERMEMVEQAAIEAEPDLYSYLLRGVTEGLSYDALKIPFESSQALTASLLGFPLMGSSNSPVLWLKSSISSFRNPGFRQAHKSPL